MRDASPSVVAASRDLEDGGGSEACALLATSQRHCNQATAHGGAQARASSRAEPRRQLEQRACSPPRRSLASAWAQRCS